MPGYRYRRRKQNCPNCNYSWCENIKDSDMKLRKVRERISQNENKNHVSVWGEAGWTVFVFRTRQVDFIWINRDQKSFEWFVSLLTKLEMDQADEEPEGDTERARGAAPGPGGKAEPL